MTCNCYSDIEKKLKDHAISKQPEGATEPSVELHGFQFVMGRNMTLQGHQAAHDVTIRYEEPKKKGGMKKTVVKMFVAASYCPFCGQKYKREEAA